MWNNRFGLAINRRCFLVAALIGTGFLWSGTAYIVQAYRLLQFLDGGTVNLLVCGVYYVCQAVGIGAFALYLQNILLLQVGERCLSTPVLLWLSAPV